MKKIFPWLFIILIITAFSFIGCETGVVEEIEVDSANPEGVKFIAPVSGLYEIAITGGSYCYLPPDEEDWSVYGGWRTMLHMYINKPIEWGEPGEWGPSPINFDDTVGPDKSAPTIAKAETIGEESSVNVQLDEGGYIILLVYDGLDYYSDNSGTVRVKITKLDQIIDLK